MIPRPSPKRTAGWKTCFLPDPDSTRTGKKGEFTHYGDQTLVLLESVARNGGFDLDDFAEKWRDRMKDYEGYMDKAAKGTLDNFESGSGPGSSGSSSEDFSAASRIAPLVYMYRDNLTGLLDAVRAQTIMTHNSSATLEAADFFARVADEVLKGRGPVATMKQLVEEEYQGSPVESLVKKGLDAADRDTVKAIGDFGRACPTGQAFPSVVQTIARYEDDLQEALVQTVMGRRRQRGPGHDGRPDPGRPPRPG